MNMRKTRIIISSVIVYFSFIMALQAQSAKTITNPFLLTGNDVYKVLKGITRNYKITLLKGKDQSLANNDTADLVMEKNTKCYFKEQLTDC